MAYVNSDVLVLDKYGVEYSGTNIKDIVLSTSPYTFIKNKTGSDVTVAFDDCSINSIILPRE